MAVAFDVDTKHVRIDTTSPQTFSHAGAASGVKGVVLLIIHGTSSTDHVTAASYGGVAMTRIVRAVDTVTEPGAAEIWFLGASVPQGTQTVSYTPGATTDDILAIAITLTGALDLEIVDSDSMGGDAANPSLTLQYASRTCIAIAALYGGGASPASFTENANCTRTSQNDFGAFYGLGTRQTTPGTADFAIGGTAASDDMAYVAVAISEVTSLSPTRGLVSFAETEIPFVATRGLISFAELETPLTSTRGLISFAEIEFPISPTRGLNSFVEFEVPTFGLEPTRGLVSWAEFEVQFQATRGIVSFAEFELPASATRGLISFAEFESPEVGGGGGVYVYNYPYDIFMSAD